MTEPERSRSKQPDRCGAVRKDGRACTSTILLTDGRCYSHSRTTSAEQRTAARTKGGHERALVRRIRRHAPLTEDLDQVFADVLAGRLHPRRALAAAAVARAIVATEAAYLGTLTRAEAHALAARLAEALKTHVRDPATLRAVLADMHRIMGESYRDDDGGYEP